MALQWLRGLARVSRKRELTWRYGFNLAPTLRFRLHRPSLLGESARVLASLNRDGLKESACECYEVIREHVDKAVSPLS